MLGVLGAIVSIAPDAWAMLFTRDETVLVHARVYLRWAGPAFAAFGLGLTLYFASQGSGKVLGPVLAATVRLALVAAVGSWLATHDAEAWQYFALVAAAMLVYGAGTALAVKVTPWRATPRTGAPRAPFSPSTPPPR
jgi:Na+-driven multidrug efflux pump